MYTTGEVDVVNENTPTNKQTNKTSMALLNFSTLII